jgi:tetratricopeptide (TPR) repeat protein
MSATPSPERELFDRALDVPIGARAVFLAQACPDPDIRARVQALLDAHDRAGERFLAQSAGELAAAAIGRAGRRLGAYQITREIGRGGMGAVYLAARADDEFQKQVAIKIVAAPLGDDDLVRRFRRERQILAELEHPQIARLLDGGTTEEGLPYLVMEYVDGLRIDEYCRGHRLAIDDRLRLFLRVCDAVQFAHTHLVIHRDLKPGNILVTPDGQPRLLDFGIASLVTADPEASTATRTVAAMTPEYASPEQMRGERVTAASDVYSLGMVLYEVLAGEPAHDFAGRRPDEVYRIVTDVEPARPSVVAGRRGDAAWSRQLRGDLDASVLMALRKEPQRRYASVALLADDITRYLEGKPITARGEAVGYRARKFVRRHRIVVAAAAAFILALVGGIVATTWMAMEAERARADAVRERDRAVAAELSATSERDRAVRAEQIAGAEQRRAEDERNRAVEQSQRADQEAATANAVRAFLEHDLLAQASPSAQVAGKLAADPDLKVRAALDRAAERVKGRFDGQPAVEGAIRQVIGLTYKDMGLYAEAEQQLTQALQLRRRALGANHSDTLTTTSELGTVYMRLGKAAQGEPLLTAAADGLRAVRGDDDRATLSALNSLALIVTGEKRERVYARILESQRRVLGEEHPDTLGVMNNLAVTYVDAGKYDDAEQLYMKLVAAKARVLGQDHPSTLLSLNALGVTYRYQGRYDAAERLLAALRDTRTRVLGPEHPDTLLTINSLALVFTAQGRDAEAENLLQRMLDARRRLLGENHPSTLGTLNNLAELHRKRGQLAQSEALYQRLLEIRGRDLPPNHPNVINTLAALGDVKLAQQQPEQAERYLRDALRGYQATNTTTWRRYYTQSLLGASMARLGRLAEAEPMLDAGHQELIRRRRAIPVENQPLLTEVKTWLAALYRDLGRPDKAVPLEAARKF